MDARFSEFVGDLARAAGSNLLSVILYGSAASGEFHARHSDLNLLCLFDRLDAETLVRINPVTQRWARKGHPPPLVFTASQLARAADVFAIELLDIQASHKVLHGADLVADLEVPMALHHLEVERELRQNLVRLRERYLASDGSRKAVLGLMTASVSSFTVLLRHAVIALEPGGEAPPVRKRDSIDRAAALIGFEARPFHTLLDLREGKTLPREVDVDVLFRDYLAAITEVVNQVDLRLEERSKG